MIVHGSFHQGDGRFSVFTRGNQCTINSLCALTYTHFSQLESSNYLDEVRGTLFKFVDYITF